MIEAQILMTLNDKDRDNQFILIARDLQCLQFYQVALIDAYVSMSDYLPEYPRLVIPVEYSSQDVVFQDTFFLSAESVGTPNAIIFCNELLKDFFGVATGVFSEADIITRICESINLRTLQNEHSLQLIGVYVPLPEPPEQPVQAPIPQPDKEVDNPDLEQE